MFHVAADRTDVAAVIAMTPLTSGLAASRASAGSRGGVRPRCGGRRWAWPAGSGGPRRGAKLMPLVSRPGEPGALALDGAYESYTSMAGPTWRNEVDAAVGFELGSIRTTSAAKRLSSRLLVQIADFDRYVPADSVVKTAVHGQRGGAPLPVRPLRRLARPRLVREGGGGSDRVPGPGLRQGPSQYWVAPWSIDIAVAVTNFDSSLASHSTALAMSSGSAVHVGRNGVIMLAS